MANTLMEGEKPSGDGGGTAAEEAQEQGHPAPEPVRQDPAAQDRDERARAIGHDQRAHLRPRQVELALQDDGQERDDERAQLVDERARHQDAHGGGKAAEEDDGVAEHGTAIAYRSPAAPPFPWDDGHVTGLHNAAAPPRRRRPSRRSLLAFLAACATPGTTPTPPARAITASSPGQPAPPTIKVVTLNLKYSRRTATAVQLLREVEALRDADILRAPRRPADDRARRARRRPRDPLHRDPPRAGHHVHGRRVRARGRTSGRRDGRARRRGVQRGVGARHRVRLLVAGVVARRPGQPGRDRPRPRAAARRARPARRRAADHQVGPARARARRDPRRGARGVPRHDQRSSAPGGGRDPAGDVRRDRGDRRCSRRSPPTPPPSISKRSSRRPRCSRQRPRR